MRAFGRTASRDWVPGKYICRPQIASAAVLYGLEPTQDLSCGTKSRTTNRANRMSIFVLLSSAVGSSPRRKGDPERSPFWPLALLRVARHRPGPALTGGTASSPACALAQAGHWAGLVEGPGLTTVGVGPNGDHYGGPLPGPFQPGGPTNAGEPCAATSPSAPMAVDAASTAWATLPTWVTSTL